jgi:uracil-DNA glycosylase family protein
VWTIHTPQGSAHWDGAALRFGPPVPRNEVLADESAAEGGATPDGVEQGWRRYYANTFNPARTNLAAMRAEMPKKYWRNLPEAQDIPALVRAAPARVQEMIARAPAMPMKRNPTKAVAAMAEREPRTLAELNRIIAASEPLVPGATRAVLGEGPENAAIAFVGEQPGDQEDLEGRPFVGPAGQLLDRAMAEAGLDRGTAYVTNAVKHFKFERRGKKRIHQKPTMGEIKHYRWWLMKELELVQPRLVVALGGTALAALVGKALPLMRSRGPMRFEGFDGFVTVHPSYLLRIPDAAEKRRAYDAFVADLTRIGVLAGATPKRPG